MEINIDRRCFRCSAILLGVARSHLAVGVAGVDLRVGLPRPPGGARRVQSDAAAVQLKIEDIRYLPV